MFYSKQNQESKDKYINSLKIVGSLSKLFSDSKTPYLYYRMSEKLFCSSFLANDLSRGDIAFDASKDNLGIGIKTFLNGNSKTLQKIAEFNKDRDKYKNLSKHEIVALISRLRNERIEFANKVSGTDSALYHCVLRDEEKFLIFEEYMDFINIDNINSINQKNNVITFNDKINEYSFNLSKSTLYKRFITDKVIDEFKVEIFDNPLEELQRCFGNNSVDTFKNAIKDTIYLPLYGRDKLVYPKSGLNQWNASGRKRDINEIYIPIPIKIHRLKPNFFPPRDKPFNLHLPNKEILNVKVCQDNSKALMSNPNEALGKWLLRDVLSLKEGEVLTYEKLEDLGIDSVRIDKIDKDNYQINFSKIGSYEEFIEYGLKYL